MGRRFISGLVRREFWGRIRAGDSIEAAVVAVGVSYSTGRRWFAEAGGVIPSNAVEPVTAGQCSSSASLPVCSCAVSPGSSYRRLCVHEREEIACRRAADESCREIAARLGRPVSTISRELGRNVTDRRRGYRATSAQAKAEARARRPRAGKLAGNEWLRGEVQRRLNDKHSPEQIAARLRAEYSDDPEMWVSHETIYQAIYVQGRGGLRRELHRCLRTGRAVRKPRRRGSQSADRGRGVIPGMVSISERPPGVEDRAVPGHWEGDLILGRNNASAVGTLVERMTRYVMLLPLPDGHTADHVQHAMITRMVQLPADLRDTLTWDRGKEMANHIAIADALDLDIYFCDPHTPWQRGSNENTNGLLRQFLPKGEDLSIYTLEDLLHIERLMNTRPRKTLEWHTPAEVLDQLFSGQFNPLALH